MTSKYVKVKSDSRWHVTPEQRHQLLQVYLNAGREAAERDCAEAGVAPSYAAKVAHDMGLARHKSFAGSMVYERKRGGRSTDHHDHRWAWAVQRGRVDA